MDAIPQIGISLLLVLPGLAAYCALYGVFGSNTLISTVPRDPKSVEALTVILLAALIGHFVMAAAAPLFAWPCALNLCFRIAPTLPEPMTAIMRLTAEGVPARSDVIAAIGEALAASVMMFFAVNLVLLHLQRTDRLPYWLYRWTAALANRADVDETVTFGYVLTNVDVETTPAGGQKCTMTVLYFGLVQDLSVDESFNISRVVLVECERHMVDLTTSFRQAILSGRARQTSASIPTLAVEAKLIRNVSFERLDLGGSPAVDPLTAGLGRLYGG